MLVQMNTRIDAETKQKGDAVFSQIGFSPSQIVRVIWEYAARNEGNPAAVGSLIDNLTAPDAAGDEQRKTRARALRQSSGLVDKLMEDRGLHWSEAYEPMPYEELREMALVERFADGSLS